MPIAMLISCALCFVDAGAPFRDHGACIGAVDRRLAQDLAADCRRFCGTDADYRRSDRAAARKVAKQVRLTAIGKLVSADFRTGLWVKDDMNFINVRQVTPDGQLRSIRIYEFNKNAELVAVREAEAGEYLQSAEWKLKNVVSTEVVGTRGSVRNQPEVLWKSALNPDILGVLLVRPSGHVAAPPDLVYQTSPGQQPAEDQRYEIALWKRRSIRWRCW